MKLISENPRFKEAPAWDRVRDRWSQDHQVKKADRARACPEARLERADPANGARPHVGDRGRGTVQATGLRGERRPE
jgi:hypothetical protein